MAFAGNYIGANYGYSAPFYKPRSYDLRNGDIIALYDLVTDRASYSREMMETLLPHPMALNHSYETKVVKVDGKFKLFARSKWQYHGSL